MKATKGNWLVVEAVHNGGHRRRGLIVDVQGEGGAPPFLVRWSEDGHESMVYPGPDAHIEEDDALSAQEAG